jgi:hypothetical protein
LCPHAEGPRGCQAGSAKLQPETPLKPWVIAPAKRGRDDVHATVAP